MSQEKKGRQPPKEHQFAKGRSGNPRGRPPKPRRAHIPTQTTKDVLKVAGSAVTINGSGGEETITVMEAVLRSLAQNAIKGKAWAAKMLWPLMMQALEENQKMHPEYELIDSLEKMARDKGIEPDEGLKSMLDDLAKKSMRPM